MKKLLLGLIRFYRRQISPCKRPCCRYFPTCSEYAQEAVERFGAISCEMEGGAIGHTCYINKVPYIVLRAMSDEADGGALDDFEAFAKKSAMNTVRLLCKMLVS